jgi:MFS family permease
MMAAFADTLGAFLVLALLPYYASELGASAFAVGWLVAAFAIAQTVTAPLWGQLSDRIGRRPVILLGLAMLVFSFATFAYADSLLVLMLSRLAQGVGGGTVSVTFALIADQSPSGDRAVKIGWLTAATSGAAVVGPLLGSLLVPLSPRAPGLAAAGLCLVALVAARFTLPIGRPSSPPSELPTARLSLLRSLAVVALHPAKRLHLLIWTYAVGMFGTNAVLAVVGLFLAQRFAVDETEIWVFFAVLAGSSLVLRVWALPPTLRRWGESRVLLAGAWLLGLAVLLFPASTSVGWVAIPTLLLAAGQSLLYPATTAQISRQGAAAEMGAVLGVQQAWGGMARILGPLAAGALFASSGTSVPFLVVGIALLSWAAWIQVRLGTPRRAA